MRIQLNHFSLIFILFSYLSVSGQTCENADFEYGNFTNWTGFTGMCCGMGITTPGIVPGRHTIITTSTLDPNTNNVISTMPTVGGGAYSVRLGNSNVGSEAEKLKRSFTVGPANQLFIYQYALVLEDPSGHPPNDKPKFEVKIYDQNGNIINPYECGYYEVTAGPETDTWGQFNEVRYKDWSTVGIDLSAYLGTVVTIEFMVQDCGWGGHFGYAYLDASCGFLDIEVIGYCEGSTSVTLVAPDGFDQYYWPHSGETTQVVTIPTPMEGDSVIVEVTNQSGCSTSILHVFEELPLIDALAGNDTLICVGQETTLWAGGAGTNGNYSWFANGIPISNDQNITVSPLVDTYYELIVSNANGCFSPDSSANVFVAVDDTLLFELPNDTVICLGDSIQISGPIGNYTYLWYAMNTTNVLGNTQSIVVSPIDSMTYFLQISNSTCSYIDSINVIVNNAAFLADTLINDFCIGDSSLTLIGPGNYANYLWSNGSVSNQTQVNPYVDTLIQLNLTTPYGCLDSMIYVTHESIPPIPVISVSDDTLCAGHTLILSAISSGTDYLWQSIPTGLYSYGSSVTLSPEMTTTYVVQAFSSVGCTDITSFDTVTIVVDTTAMFELGPNLQICEGDTVELNGPGGMLVYEWYANGSVFSTDSSVFVSPTSTDFYFLTTYSPSCSYSDFLTLNVDEVSTIPLDVFSCIGNNVLELNAPSGYVSVFWPQFNNSDAVNFDYNPQENQLFIVYATDQYSCVDTFNLIVDIIDSSELTPMIDQVICVGDQITLTAISNYSFDQFVWTPIPSGLSFQGNPLVISPNSNISYVVTLSNQYNCVEPPAIDSFTVFVNDEYVIPPIDPIAACLGESLSLSSPNSIGNFSWTYANQQSSNSIFNFTAEQSGLINVIVQNGICSDSQQIPITVNTPSSYSISTSLPQLCAGTSTTLSVSPSSFNDVTWSQNAIDLGNSATLVITPESSGSYIASILDLNNCMFDTSIFIQVNSYPIVDLGPDLIVCKQTSMQLQSAANLSNASYLWSTNDTSETINVTNSGTYWLFVNNNNCVAQDSIYVEFNPISFIDQIPNVITPNNDFVNDLLSFQSSNLAEYQLVILNRWGNTIFETDNPTNFWDGKNGDRFVDDGVYFYKITYRLICDEEVSLLHGNISVVK